VATVVGRSLSRNLLQAAIDVLTVPAIRIGLCIYNKKERLSNSEAIRDETVRLSAVVEGFCCLSGEAGVVDAVGDFVDGVSGAPECDVVGVGVECGVGGAWVVVAGLADASGVEDGAVVDGGGGVLDVGVAEEEAGVVVEVLS